MSGVRTGTRLQQLEQLQATARLQRAHARWKGDHRTHDRLDRLVHAVTEAIREEQRQRPTIAAAVRRTDQTVEQRLRDMGVTTHAVKVWAVEQGLLAAVLRGRVSSLLVDAYATAHQHQETNRG